MPKRSKKSPEVLRVLFLAAEADPFFKVGGLGDVAFSLPYALQSLLPSQVGNKTLDVRLALPCHASILKKIPDCQVVARYSIPALQGSYPVEVLYTKYNGISIYLISGVPIPPDSSVYSGDNHLDGLKYAFFSQAALELGRNIGWKPDIIHANDWHTAPTVYVLEQKRKLDSYYASIHSILTIHNLPFMGSGTSEELASFGILPSSDPRLPDWARHIPLPMGMAVADQITTVSPTYARELLTPEFGCGLQDFFKSRQDALEGIINGLDIESWNPATDPAIPQNFNQETIDLRQKNKEALLKEFSLPPTHGIPLLILVSRMDPQKGVDIALEGLRETINQPWQAILLGTGYSQLERDCLRLEAEYPDRVRAAIRFDTKLSRRMYSGADILLMPSIYEPCGLSQMIAMRYGCVPLARATGGLKDSIIDAGTTKEGDGFLFETPAGVNLGKTLRRALKAYQDKTEWLSIQQRGMEKDFSWRKSAVEYARIYNKIMREGA